MVEIDWDLIDVVEGSNEVVDPGGFGVEEGVEGGEV